MNKSPLYAVFDLDNCLSDDRARIPLIDFTKTGDARWDRYHEVCGQDPVANVDTFKDCMRVGLSPVFITMRPERVRDRTLSWIAFHLGVRQPLLVMRKDGDRTPSVDAKQQAAICIGAHNIAIAFDDREDIVAAYKALGINAQRLRIHDVSATEPPAPAAGHDHLPDAPPTRGEQPARYDPEKQPRFQPRVGHPFTTDPLKSFAKTTGAPTHEKLAPAAEWPFPPREREPATAGNFLLRARSMFIKKNAEYGNDYQQFGAVAAALFPDGLTIKTEEQWGRLAVFMWSLSKMGRYAKNLEAGGHPDSAEDMIVYAAMLRELTDAGAV